LVLLQHIFKAGTDLSELRIVKKLNNMQISSSIIWLDPILHIFEISEAQFIVPGWEDNVDNPILQSRTMNLGYLGYIQYVCQVPARIFSAAHSKLRIY
jgi:hypothetical protein